MNRDVKICLREFKRFHKALMKTAPEGYTPWYFPCKAGRIFYNEKNERVVEGKDPDSETIMKRGKNYGSWHHETARLNYYEAIEVIKAGGNIGLSARNTDKLIIGDIDDEKYLDQMPKNTLTTISRKRLAGHFFFWDSDGTAKLNLPTSYGEMRSKNQYVLIPASYVPTPDNPDELAGYYTIREETSPRYATFEDLPQFFKDTYFENQKKDEEVKERLQKNPVKYTGAGHPLYEVRMSDILGHISPNKRFKHPLHDSDTDANCSMSSDGTLIFCWRHMVSLNALQYYQVKSGAARCEDAGTPFYTGGRIK